MLNIKTTKRFRKDLQSVAKQGKDIKRLMAVVSILQEEKPLPPKCHDHVLRGNYGGHRECHIESDWLLIYAIEDDGLILRLTRTGSHSDLF